MPDKLKRIAPHYVITADDGNGPEFFESYLTAHDAVEAAQSQAKARPNYEFDVWHWNMQEWLHVTTACLCVNADPMTRIDISKTAQDANL